MFKEAYKKHRHCLIFCFLIFVFSLAIIFLDLTKSQNAEIMSLPSQKCEDELENQHPPVTSNEDFYGEKSHFKFSPNKKYITFVQNVFEEYGNDWDKYWALQLFNIEDATEKTLVVDDTRMSSYEWLDDNMIRVFHNAGTGVRGYRDIAINIDVPLFSKDYKRLENEFFWEIDEEYTRKVKEIQEAREMYYLLSH